MVVCVWSWLIFVVWFFEFQGPMLLFHSPFLSSSVIFRGIVFCITGGEGDFNEAQNRGGEGSGCVDFNGGGKSLGKATQVHSDMD